jgi:cellulose synthase/poly-beta-1,6-N-acetylglucosamine synthase-like glycosyltransferase
MSSGEELYYWIIWWGWWILQFCLYCLFAALTVDGIYQFVVGFRGWWGSRPLPSAENHRRFAVLVPAHNEARVIAPLLRSLRDQDYPKDCYTVFVSCDNCTDDTAEVARAEGAVALIRTDTTKNGKTWNVRWALTQLPMDDVDALVMFDADNLAEENFLARMNDYMDAHPEAEAVQGVLDVKNPDDNWLTKAYALAYWYTNRFWQHARGLWGLSCTLGGTGLVIRSSTLRRLGWNLESLTEDLEMSTRIILSGSRVHWNDTAVIYDEKPTDISISRRQRTRWMQGHYWVCLHYGRAALAAFFRTRRLQYLDLFLYLLAPAKACISLGAMIVGMIYTFVNNAILFPTLESQTPQTVFQWVAFVGLPVALIFAHCALVVLVGPSMQRKKLTFKYVPAVFAYFWFGITWIPILFRAAFLSGKQEVWVKTEHTRSISLEQVGHRR